MSFSDWYLAQQEQDEMELKQLKELLDELKKLREWRTGVLQASVYSRQSMPNPHKCWACGSVIEHQWLVLVHDGENVTDLECPICESINVTRLEV